MKLPTLVFVLAAAASAVSIPTCKNPTVLCKYVSPRNAGRCSGLIDAKKMKVATCQAVAPTITSTRTIQPTAFVTRTIYPQEVTKKIEKTITKAGPPITQPTLKLTVTSTQIVETTVIDTTVSTATSTAVTTEFETTWTTSTVTELSTSTVSWVKPYCGVRRKKRCVDLRDIKKRNDRRAPLPEECSCFLTSTQPYQSTQTATVTVKKSPCTETTYVEKSQARTVTRTVTFTKYTGGRTLCAPEATETVIQTVTQTIHTLTTIFDTSVTTSTQHDTTTITDTTATTEIVIETADPCDDVSEDAGYMYRMNQLANDVVGETSNGLTVNECCRSCYGNPSCAYFRHKVEPELECTNYFISDDATELYCQGLTDMCPVGFVVYAKQGPTVDPDFDYWWGPCLGFAPQQR
ncbi:hypothetical protein BGZ61DRAFT_540697 [Ilyonectria robusta]|uniref:uncharacterized protein n=1 Tax=Ilyonectria robusta TaxID=1079257 RepID=UPI001E8E2FF6|nr:uncharacterized protein BGZ61DRAFT_540697 [Ilyonectria robusta]KAH8656877.1 hypothetical protein BGZ61DRAFT_540697 [Ilyonectria robusta]